MCDRVVLVVAGQPVRQGVRDVIDFPSDRRHPTPTSAAAARERQDTLTKPPGSLGRLEDLSVWVAACQGVCPPRQFERARVVVFAGDHGVARPGCRRIRRRSPLRWSPTSTRGGAAINVLAEVAGAAVRVVDIAVDCDEPLTPAIGAHKVRRSSGEHRRRGRADRRRGARRDRGRPADRRRGGRRRRRPADRRRHGDRKHHGGNDFGGGADRHRAGRGGRPRHRDRRRRVDAQDDRGAQRDVPGARDARDPMRCCARCGGADLAAMAGFCAQAAVAAHPAAARRRGGDGRRAGRRPAGAGRAAVVAGRSPVHRTRAHAWRWRASNSSRSSTCGCGSGEGTGARWRCRSCGPRWPRLASMATFDEASVSGRPTEP